MESETRRHRSPGVRYPGASIDQVLHVARLLDEVGGEMAVGRVAAKLGKAEGNAAFMRLLAAGEVFGLLTRSKDQRRIAITDRGRKALSGDRTALRDAFYSAPVFAQLANRFRGRMLPKDEDLAIAATEVGVAEAGAKLAARNFVASARLAGLLEEEGGRLVFVDHEPEEDLASHALEPSPEPLEPVAAVRDEQRPAGRTGATAPATAVQSTESAFWLAVDEETLGRLSEEEFKQVWDAMGLLLRRRSQRRPASTDSSEVVDA